MLALSASVFFICLRTVSHYQALLFLSRPLPLKSIFTIDLNSSLTQSSPGGGMRTTTNRTLWPITGGAISLQPGWFQGHATAFFYMNMGFGTDGPDNGPPNMSFPLVPVFQIVGPSKAPWPGTFCLPQVPLPSGVPPVKAGDNATIQVVETAIHGAALYSVCLSSSPRSNC